ncbi:MAG: retropepsin-like domain-containing protein [Defluviitaleaceae bacterium]|nr:retropepsin-like domain-containing protein [Defluviitaleaceae bacterium]MCL2239670.1 retropepsin-like domain-containing protein [Defluviitaleaceae bacterium]
MTVTLQTIHESSPVDGTDLQLIIDTGAHLTVLSRATAIMRGFHKLPKIPTFIHGYSGKEPADFVYIQGFKILGKVITHVPVLIPHALHSIDPETKEKRQFQEVLGLNVLEYFNYYVCTEEDKLYMKWNPAPRPHNDKLACGEIYTVQGGLTA